MCFLRMQTDSLVLNCPSKKLQAVSRFRTVGPHSCWRKHNGNSEMFFKVYRVDGVIVISKYHVDLIRLVARLVEAASVWVQQFCSIERG